MASLGSEKRFQSDILDDFEEESNWKVIREDMSVSDVVSEYGEEYIRDDSDVIFKRVLEKELVRLNDEVNDDNVEFVLDEIFTSFHDGFDLLSRNRSFSKLLRSGGDVVVDGDGVSFDLFDFDDPCNNDFFVFEEFSFSVGDNDRRRPDLVFVVNGIPLVVSELKSSAKGNSVTEAIEDLEDVYQREASDLFVPNVLCVAANQSLFRYGSVGCGLENYVPWSGGEDEGVLEDVSGDFLDLLSPSVLLDILDNFIFFKDNRGSIEKIIPWRHQFLSANQILNDIRESIERSKFRSHLIGHVQGSGKSFAMLYAGRLLFEECGSQVFIVVDKNNLEDQFISDLRSIDDIRFTSAESGSHLEDLIEVGESGIVLTTVQKFGQVDYENIVPGNDNPVVFADEAHRFLDEKLGSMMEATLSEFHYYGFTGTPNNAFELFSVDREDNFLNEYSMGDGVNDGVILPVNMEYRGDVWNMDYGGMDVEFEGKLGSDLSYEEKREVINNEVTPSLLGRIKPRVDNITDDIVDHYDKNVRPFKGMVVTPYRENAAVYGEFLKDKMSEEEVEVLYSTSGKKNKDVVQKFEKSEEEQENIREKFKDPDSDLKIVVVCDMLLTGFDAPILQTIFLDRDVSEGHTLLQIIARTNRNRENKSYGEVIDYQGVITNFEDLVDYSSEEIEKFKTEDKEAFIEKFEKMLEKMKNYFPEHVSDKIDRNEYPELEDCLDTFDTTTKQDNYLQDFKELRILFENIEPDKRLTKYQKEYEIYEKIYQAMKQTKKDTTTRDKQDIVKQAIEDNTKHRLEETNYKLEIDEIDSDNSLKVVEKQGEVQEFLDKNKHKDPRYHALSEKVRDIINDWDSNRRQNNEVIDNLNKILSQIDKIEKEHEKADLDEEARPLMFHLRDYGVKEEKAKEVAQEIINTLELENIDKFYSGEFNSLKKIIIEKLAENNIINQVNDYEQLTETIVKNKIRN